MRFQLRMLAWSTRAAIEQVLVLGVGGLGVALAALLFLLFLASVALRGLLPGMDAREELPEVQALAGASTLLDQAPPGARSASTLRLEKAAAELAILRHAGAPQGQGARDGAVESPPRLPDALTGATTPDYEAWRAANHDRIEQVVAAVLAAPPPFVEADPPTSDRAPQFDLEGLWRLERVLLAEARSAIADRRPDDTARCLEAAWRVNEGLLETPRLAVLDTATSGLEGLLATLRSAPGPPDGWESRLAGVDPVATARAAYLAEGLRLRTRAETAVVDRTRQLGFILVPFARLLVTPQQRALRGALTRLDPAQVAAFDPEAFAAELDGKLPRWNRVARDAMPASWRSWPRAVHAALAVDLTRRTLEVRRRDHAGGAAAARSQPTSWPEPLTGGAWACRTTDRAATIRLAPDPFDGSGLPPLEQVIVLGDPLGDAQ